MKIKKDEKETKPFWVYIRWKDHWAQTGWRTKEDHLYEPEICETIGYQIFEDGDGYVVASTYCNKGEDNFDSNARMYILKAAILEYRKLK